MEGAHNLVPRAFSQAREKALGTRLRGSGVFFWGGLPKSIHMLSKVVPYLGYLSDSSWEVFHLIPQTEESYSTNFSTLSCFCEVSSVWQEMCVIFLGRSRHIDLKGQCHGILASLYNAEICSCINGNPKMMHFCYLGLYHYTETIYCCLTLSMARMEMD